MKTDPTAYYATAAQVLPVLALLVIFELRLLGNWGEYWRCGGTRRKRGRSQYRPPFSQNNGPS